VGARFRPAECSSLQTHSREQPRLALLSLPFYTLDTKSKHVVCVCVCEVHWSAR
jgi:hypothetical protein